LLTIYLPTICSVFFPICQYQTSFYKNYSFNRSFYHSAPVQWNSLPSDLRHFLFLWNKCKCKWLTFSLHTEPAFQQIAPASYTCAPGSAHGNCSGRQRKRDTRSTERSCASLLHVATSANTITGLHKITMTRTNLLSNA